MNDEAHKEAERELDRMAKLPTQAAEYGGHPHLSGLDDLVAVGQKHAR